MRKRTRRVAAPLAAFCLTVAAGAGAAEPQKPDPLAGRGGVATIDANVGSASTEVPVELPAYHGLTPSLSLRYSSGAGNGYVGVGWSLAGLASQIVRGAPKRWGSPRFTGDDTFTL